MAMYHLNLPTGLEDAVALTPLEFEQQVRLMAAIKMFELGKLSSGHAAELADLTRTQFFEMCAIYGVPVVNYPPDELDGELALLEKWNKAQ